MLALLAVAAAFAPAATVGVEGTELVYRSAPGLEDRLQIASDGRAATFISTKTSITPAAGCTAIKLGVRCPVAGIAAILVLADDGGDFIDADVELPLVAELGPGDDQFQGHGPALTLTAGDGNDYTTFSAPAGTYDLGPGDDEFSDYGVEGPVQVLGGDGNDRLDVVGSSGPGAVVSGGPGDDFMVVDVRSAADIACGPGADLAWIRVNDRTGDGCAPRLEGITPRSVSRVFREGTLPAPAVGSVKIRPLRQARWLFRGAFDAPAGPLSVRTKTTKVGRRWLRGKARRVTVVMETRAGGDRVQVEFNSKLR